jgi:plasmid stabilization system protein ParE
MPRVIFAARARADLSRLHRFHAEKDGNVARRAILAIRAAFMPLTQMPLIGRPVDDHAELRELVIDFGTSGYLALYRYESSRDTVVILAIKHQLEDGYT